MDWKKYKNNQTQLCLTSLVLFVIAGVLVVAGIGSYHNQFVTSYVAANSLASHISTVFAPASKNLWAAATKWLLLALVIFSLVILLLELLKLPIKAQWKKTVNLNLLHSVDQSVSLVFMVVMTALFFGLQDVMSLLLALVLTLTGLWLLNFTNDHRKDTALGGARLAVWGIISLKAPWLLIIVYALGTSIYGMVRYPWFIYLIGLVALVASISYMRILLYQPKTKKSQQFQLFITSQSSKILFVVVLIIGLWR